MSATKPLIGVYGNLIYDEVVVVDEYSEGESNLVKHCYHQVGGAMNVARTLHRISEFQVVIHGAIGEDEQSKYIENSVYDEMGLSDDGLLYGSMRLFSRLDRLGEDNSDRAYVCVNKESGKITSFFQNNPELKFIPQTYPGQVWSHIAYLDTCHSIGVDDLRRMRREGITISADLAGSLYGCGDQLASLVSEVDYLIVSEANILEFGSSIVNLPKHGVVKHNSLGAQFMGRFSSLVGSGAKEITGKANTLGAGDAFAAGFITAKLLGGTIQQSLECGNDTAYDHIKLNG